MHVCKELQLDIGWFEAINSHVPSRIDEYIQVRTAIQHGRQEAYLFLQVYNVFLLLPPVLYPFRTCNPTPTWCILCPLPRALSYQSLLGRGDGSPAWSRLTVGMLWKNGCLNLILYQLSLRCLIIFIPIAPCGSHAQVKT